MFRTIKAATLVAMLSVSAITASAAQVQPSLRESLSQFHPISARTTHLVALRNGFTLHEYEDGKMALENPVGRPVSTHEGQVLTAANGTTIRMVGNEVARLSAEIRSMDHR